MSLADQAPWSGATVSDMQAATLRRYPGRTALVVGEVRYTYADMAANISRIAQLLKSRGLGRGDGLAVLSSNRAEVVFANWAAQSLGIRYTPLHPRGSEADHLYVLRHAQISALVIDDASFRERSLALRAGADLKHVFSLGGGVGSDLLAEAAEFTPRPPQTLAQPGDICAIHFTGGTTGRPKGVVHRHASMNLATVLALAFWDWPAEVKFLVATPISHAAGRMLAPTLMQGGELHILPAFDPQSFLQTIERERITATFVVPSMIYDLLDRGEPERYDLSSLETIIYGASPISPARLREAITRIGPKFCQLYGQTETTSCLAYLSKADHDLSRPHLLESCGLPLAPSMVRLLKGDGTEAAVGEAGEICVRSPLVMSEYWNDPDETAKAFENGWLHTGDVARQDAEGYLYIVDRVKDMVISGGFNVFSREVEDCLAQHPAVASAAVIGIPHPRWGEAVAAFVTLKAGAAVACEELIDLVREKKGPVHAPKSLEIVDRLPLTSVGKIDKRALRTRYWPADGRAIS